MTAAKRTLTMAAIMFAIAFFLGVYAAQLRAPLLLAIGRTFDVLTILLFAAACVLFALKK